MANKPLRVIVVGSEARNTQQAGRAIEHEDLLFDCQHVEVAHLGQTLERSKDGGPHLILLDCELSGEDIAKTVARIRESGACLPVLVLPQDGPSSAETFFLPPTGKRDSRGTLRRARNVLLRSLCMMPFLRDSYMWSYRAWLFATNLLVFITVEGS